MSSFWREHHVLLSRLVLPPLSRGNLLMPSLVKSHHRRARQIWKAEFDILSQNIKKTLATAGCQCDNIYGSMEGG